VLLDSFLVPAWIDSVFEQLSQVEHVDLAVVVLDEHTPSSPRPLARVREALPHVLYDLYEKVDHRLFSSPDDAYRPVDARRHFTCQVLEVSREVLERPEQLTVLGDLRLDVLLQFGFGGAGRNIAQAARYGLWSCSVNEDHESGLGVFRKLLDGKHVTCIELEMLTERANSRVIYRSFSAVDPISLHRTRNDANWKAADVVVRCLRRLTSPEGQLAENFSMPDQRIERDTPTQRYPTNVETARFLARVGARMARRKVRTFLFDPQWFIAYRSRRTSGLVLPPDMTGFTLVVPATDRAYADPFVVKALDGRRFIFFEDFRNVDGKAVISRVELFSDGTISDPRVVLERDYHLSYPFVFFSGGEAYLLPETAQARRLELYRAVDFPDRWELERVLMDGSMVFDATLLEHGDKVWMFANLATSQGTPSDELSLFWSDSLAGEWQPHQQNPVISDVRCARPAGRVIVQDGRLIRPAQDGSVRYGYALVFKEILELSERSFREIELGRVMPDWIEGNLCTHHYDADGEIEVVDGRQPVPRWLRRKTHELRYP
jgi:hypothetical protein